MFGLIREEVPPFQESVQFFQEVPEAPCIDLVLQNPLMTHLLVQGVTQSSTQR